MHKLVIGRPPSAATNFFVLAYLLVPTFAAAQAPQATESVNVLDANSATVATLSMPRSSIQISEIAVLINDNDPQSVEIANYYQRVRNIPSQNMIHLNFDQNKIYPGFTVNQGIDPADFAVLKAQVDATVGNSTCGAGPFDRELTFTNQLFNTSAFPSEETWTTSIATVVALPCEPLLRLAVNKPLHRL
jgi:hypothetical protein